MIKKICSAAIAFMAVSSQSILAGGDAPAVGIEPTADYNRLTLEYTYRDYSGFSTDGVQLGFVHGFSLSQSAPVFIQTGIKADVGFKGIEARDILGVTSLKGKLDLTTLSFSVPLDIAFKLVAGESRSFAFMPYAGFNFKLNALANAKAEASYAGKRGKTSVSLFDRECGMRRFQPGWHVGMALLFGRFTIGVQYGSDFVTIVENGNHTPTFNAGLGIAF